MASESALAPQRVFCPYFTDGTRRSKTRRSHWSNLFILITEIKSSELIVSRRRLIEQERAAKKDARLAELSAGMNLLGTILNITQHGAFVDLNGVDGLIPIHLL